MVKRFWAAFGAVTLGLFVLAAAPVAGGQSSASGAQPGGENSLRLEQVQARLPQLALWFYPGSTPKDLSASLGGQALALEELRQADAQDPVQYYFLVDCSTSTSYGQMEAVKAALLEFADALPEGAGVNLIGFGTGVELLLQNSRDAEALREAVAKLEANQPGTLFFDAVARAVALASAEELAQQRKLMFVFSDSVDYNLGGYTKDEVDALLAGAQLPLYALGFESGNKAELDSFGALARASGGGIAIVNEQTLGESLRGLLAQTGSAWMARFTAPGNRADEPAVLHLGVDGQSAEALPPLRHWVPDTEAPRLLSATQAGEDSLLLQFSEPVAGAGSTESYLLKNETGGLLGLAAAAYDEASLTATLTLAQPPAEAQITLSCPGVADLSREENPVADTLSLDFTGPAVSTTAAPPAQEEGVPMAAWVLLTLAGVGVLLAVTVAMVKKRGGLAVQEGKLHFGGQPPVEERAELPAAPGGQVHFVQGELPLIRLDVTGAAGPAKRVEIPISGSLFVGRSEMCDVMFDDPAMSRQHFVIEEKNGAYTLTSLSQSSGTLLNGVPVEKPRPLCDGDTIEAGRMRIVFHPAGTGGPP